uniref:Uncharacterized protein n=1 Tax=Chromera velia CCMP2878 TaxID=1169474 RepID=A0A0G4I661_9ALVE|eukprot:Cvel_11321.t1-p1 / transcript=Cvel_11321.t1 / gene=Cvel_11321 / organism=Chromera_velia_CCMP2878 / gene_product=hypothetical protein / transcript_product=hypothetical protein / location=Cvel_scaffold708:43115-44878(-) / protein_length=206 / sequence_SO=supercontig / SO=protein_coding / is_pseudo=false
MLGQPYHLICASPLTVSSELYLAKVLFLLRKSKGNFEAEQEILCKGLFEEKYFADFLRSKKVRTVDDDAYKDDPAAMTRKDIMVMFTVLFRGGKDIPAYLSKHLSKADLDSNLKTLYSLMFNWSIPDPPEVTEEKKPGSHKKSKKYTHLPLKDKGKNDLRWLPDVVDLLIKGMKPSDLPPCVYLVSAQQFLQPELGIRPSTLRILW